MKVIMYVLSLFEFILLGFSIISYMGKDYAAFSGLLGAAIIDAGFILFIKIVVSRTTEQ